jgi:glucosamine--fructose-6-phosphate aminotransferase (isomerizing)
MILNEPAIAAACIDAVGIDAVEETLRDALEAGGRVTVVGCGTSHHAARSIAAQLDEARGHRGVRPQAPKALDVVTEPPTDGLVIGVSHEGETRATMLALHAAREAGCATALITARPESSLTRTVDQVVVTPTVDAGWCHTVGYLSPLVVGAVLAGRVAGKPVSADVVRDHVARCVAERPAAVAMAAGFDGCDRFCVVGAGIDEISADELVLKIEEGVRVPASERELETFLHGHLAACDDRTGLVVIASEHRGRARRSDRGRLLLRAARRVGIHCGAILVPAVESIWGRELTDAGRIPIPHEAKLPPSSSALIASAIALQLLTLELAHARGVYPDLIRRELEPWREAAAIAEGDVAW